MLKSRHIGRVVKLGLFHLDNAAYTIVPVQNYKKRLHTHTYMEENCNNLLKCTSSMSIFLNATTGNAMLNHCQLSHFHKASSVTLTDENLLELANDVINRASNHDKMALSLPKKQVSRGIRDFLQFGFTITDIQTLFSHPDLLKNIADLLTSVRLFAEFGFTVESTAKILTEVPNVATMNREGLIGKINDLHGVGFSSVSLVNIISNSPRVLELNIGKYLVPRMETLKTLFKTQDAFNIVEKVPQLLLCDIREIEERFHYIFGEMGITQRQMLNANLFSYPMEHIVARHMFLVRTGFFKKIIKPEKQLNKNPLLQNILGFSDEKFAKKFGGMTGQHYRTFKKLLEEEKQYL